MKSITHIITGLDVGGAERALHTLLTNGLEGPFRNHVVSLMGPGHYGPLLEQAGILYNAHRSRCQHSEIGYSDGRAHHLPNGFDTIRWQPDAKARAAVRAELGLSERDRVIGFVGRGHPEKDPASLFQAFSQVAAHNPRAVLVATGRDLDRFEVPEGRIILTGQHNNVPRLMQGFDLFCLSSRVEGFPNVIGEAMATGIPCVTTDVGDAAAIVGTTGWAVPPCDSNALARALIEAIDTPVEYLRLRGAAARRRIVAEFSIASVVAKYIALYERLIEERR